jgi:hypothetical protein
MRCWTDERREGSTAATVSLRCVRGRLKRCSKESLNIVTVSDIRDSLSDKKRMRGRAIFLINEKIDWCSLSAHKNDFGEQREGK